MDVTINSNFLNCKGFCNTLKVTVLNNVEFLVCNFKLKFIRKFGPSFLEYFFSEICLTDKSGLKLLLLLSNYALKFLYYSIWGPLLAEGFIEFIIDKSFKRRILNNFWFRWWSCKYFADFISSNNANKFIILKEVPLFFLHI